MVPHHPHSVPHPGRAQGPEKEMGTIRISVSNLKTILIHPPGVSLRACGRAAAVGGAPSA